jgi:hypothetical protein
MECMVRRKPHDNQLCRIRAEAQAILADPERR